jgi:hypothetical protein
MKFAAEIHSTVRCSRLREISVKLIYLTPRCMIQRFDSLLNFVAKRIDYHLQHAAVRSILNTTPGSPSYHRGSQLCDCRHTLSKRVTTKKVSGNV